MALLAFAVPSAHAQGVQGTRAAAGPTVARAAAGPTVARAAAGPTVARAAVGVRAATGAPAKTPPKFAETRRNKAMMIVGGAALIVGAIIDKPAGTIIMLGGAGVGLYGLYKYLE
jgi:hypothetical protein